MHKSTLLGTSVGAGQEPARHPQTRAVAEWERGMGKQGTLLLGREFCGVTFPLPRLAPGWSCGSSVLPRFSSVLFNQLSVSCQKLEVEHSGEQIWMVCKMRSLSCCSVCSALGNTALAVSLEGGVNKPGVVSGTFLWQSWLLLLLSSCYCYILKVSKFNPRKNSGCL